MRWEKRPRSMRGNHQTAEWKGTTVSDRRSSLGSWLTAEGRQWLSDALQYGELGQRWDNSFRAASSKPPRALGPHTSAGGWRDGRRAAAGWEAGSPRGSSCSSGSAKVSGFLFT